MGKDLRVFVIKYFVPAFMVPGGCRYEPAMTSNSVPKKKEVNDKKKRIIISPVNVCSPTPPPTHPSILPFIHLVFNLAWV